MQTGIDHVFREMLEHILPISADEADDLTARIVRRLR